MFSRFTRRKATKTAPAPTGSLALDLHGRVRSRRRRVARITPAASSASRSTWY